ICSTPSWARHPEVCERRAGSLHRLAEVDPVVAILLAPLGLLPAVAEVEGLVLGHQGMGIEAQLAVAPAARLLFRGREQEIAEAAPLKGRIDRDVVDQQVILAG